MKFLNFAVCISTLLPVVTSLKCWISVENAPTQSPFDFEESDYCGHYKYKCSATDTACSGVAVGTIQTAYVTLSSDNVKDMSSSAIYMDFYYCNT